MQQTATTALRIGVKGQKQTRSKAVALLWTSSVALFFALGFFPVSSATAEEEGEKKSSSLTAVEQIGLWLVGVHPVKDNPAHQFVAHHFCHQLTADLMQCVLYDGNKKDSRLIGVEYIISQAGFEKLSKEEKQYWHPHNYEILSGQLVAPGVSDAVDHKLMAGKINSYGKTWHTWMSGVHGQEDEALPLGNATLVWSLNHDGEAKPEILNETYKELGFDWQAKRKVRKDLIPQAEPQCGVKVLAGQFPQETSSIAGVEAKENCY